MARMLLQARVTVEIDDVPNSSLDIGIIKDYLNDAVILDIDTEEYGRGPENSIVNVNIDWNTLKLKPIREMNE